MNDIEIIDRQGLAVTILILYSMLNNLVYDCPVNILSLQMWICCTTICQCRLLLPKIK